MISKNLNNISSSVLIIAGSDPSGGAGIQADLKTLTSLGVYGMTAITALTVQNTKGVKSVIPVSPNLIKDQIIYSAKDIKPDAIKIGMLHSKLVIKKVMDVTKKDDIVSVSKELCEQGLRLDILINNAAIDPKVDKNKRFKENSRFENFRLDEWYLQLNVGLTGAFLCSQVFGSKMASDKKGGVILNIASEIMMLSP